jgi:hypothetical protein
LATLAINSFLFMSSRSQGPKGEEKPTNQMPWKQETTNPRGFARVWKRKIYLRVRSTGYGQGQRKAGGTRMLRLLII